MIRGYAHPTDLLFQAPRLVYGGALTLQGFVRNLDFLKSVFDPTYQILGFRDVNDTDTLARWTMGFDVLPIQRSPLGRWWWPRLEFTGTTLYGTSAKTGLIERHLDTWDSIEHQEYFSLEGFRHMLGQIFTLRAPPQLRGPDFTLLKCESTLTSSGSVNLAAAADWSESMYGYESHVSQILCRLDLLR